jgi:hypothetical protein
VTHQNKEKKMKKRSSLKDEFVFRDNPINHDYVPFPNKSTKNAIRFLESIESLKKGKIVETRLSELPQK